MGRTTDPEYPQWVCDSCGRDFGDWWKKGVYIGPPHHCATYHNGTCGVCGAKDVSVSEPRDYGHLHAKWRATLIRRLNNATEAQDS